MLRVFVITLSLTLATGAVRGESLILNKPLPILSIDDRGELLLENNEYSYRPWTSKTNPPEVHVLQYFPGTKAGSIIFEPFTDILQKEFSHRSYHVTTIINLDAALWGTSGFVTGEAKASKKQYPASTMVLDEEGSGKATWELGNKGAVLVVMDKEGYVIYLSHKPMSEQDINATIALMRDRIQS